MKPIFIVLISLLFALPTTILANKVDSLIIESKKIESDYLRLDFLKNKYDNIDTSPDKLKYIKEYLQLANDSRISYYQIDAHLLFLYYYFNVNNLYVFTKEAKNTYPFLLKNHAYRDWIEVKTMEMIINAWYDNYELAILIGKQTLKTISNLNIKEHEKRDLYSALGYAYYSSGRYKEALTWYQKAKQNIQGPDSIIHKLNLHIDLFNCYLEMDSIPALEKSIDSTRKLIKQLKKQEKEPLFPEYYNFIAHIQECDLYKEKKNKDQLRKSLIETEELYKNQPKDDYYDSTLASFWIAYYSLAGDYNKIPSLIEEMKQKRDSNQLTSLYPILRIETEAIAKSEQWEKALKAYQRLNFVDDSIQKEVIALQAEQTDNFYQVSNLNNKNKAKQKKVNILLLSVLLLFILILILSIITYFLIKYFKYLNKAKQEAIIADKYISNFLQQTKTKVNTALKDISNCSQHLIFEKDIKQKKQYAQKIDIINKDLQQMVYNILDLSKIEAGEMKLFLKEESIELLLIDVVNTIKKTINDSTISIETVSSDIGLFLLDSICIKQILRSLLNISLFHLSSKIQLTAEKKNESLCFQILFNGNINKVDSIKKSISRAYNKYGSHNEDFEMVLVLQFLKLLESELLFDYYTEKELCIFSFEIKAKEVKK